MTLEFYENAFFILANLQSNLWATLNTEHLENMSNFEH